MDLFESACGNVIFCGDIHGVDVLRGVVFDVTERYGLTDCAVVVCGDCGFGFEKRGYYDRICSSVAKRLESNNIEVYMLRGNHDDPSYFSGDSRFDSGNVRCVPDYGVVSVGGHNILCVGGAVSIDRSVRTEGKSWWPGEGFVFDKGKIDTVCSSVTVDMVATHTSPLFCPPFGGGAVFESWSAKDPSVVEDCNRERKDMCSMYDYLEDKQVPVGHWHYGHFHGSYGINVNGCMFAGLGIREISRVFPGGQAIL